MESGGGVDRTVCGDGYPVVLALGQFEVRFGGRGVYEYGEIMRRTGTYPLYKCFHRCCGGGPCMIVRRQVGCVQDAVKQCGEGSQEKAGVSHDSVL